LQRLGGQRQLPLLGYLTQPMPIAVVLDQSRTAQPAELLLKHVKGIHNLYAAAPNAAGEF
jgi:hypothetical protein